MRPVLFYLSQSPWSEKARWALDHHQIDYRPVEHLPLVFEPVVRLASRRPFVKPTVPMLVTVARFAERTGRGEPLFPPGFAIEIEQWEETAESMMNAGRAELVRRLLGSDAALAESVPAPLNRFASTMKPMARLATKFLGSKHQVNNVSGAQAEATIEAGLAKLRAALQRAGGRYLCGGGFSFADVAMAVTLQYVRPHPRVGLGPALTEIWRNPGLERSSADLLEWRDQLVDAKR
jgi:glutathione S-transferase